MPAPVFRVLRKSPHTPLPLTGLRPQAPPMCSRDSVEASAAALPEINNGDLPPDVAVSQARLVLPPPLSVDVVGWPPGERVGAEASAAAAEEGEMEGRTRDAEEALLADTRHGTPQSQCRDRSACSCDEKRVFFVWCGVHSQWAQQDPQTTGCEWAVQLCEFLQSAVPLEHFGQSGAASHVSHASSRVHVLNALNGLPSYLSTFLSIQPPQQMND